MITITLRVEFCYYEKVANNGPILLDNLPFDIPDSWEWARLKDIVYNHGQKTPNSNFLLY